MINYNVSFSTSMFTLDALSPETSERLVALSGPVTCRTEFEIRIL